MLLSEETSVSPVHRPVDILQLCPCSYWIPSNCSHIPSVQLHKYIICYNFIITFLYYMSSSLIALSEFIVTLDYFCPYCLPPAC